MFVGKPNGTLLTNEVKEQIDDAAVSTSKAFSAVRRARVSTAILCTLKVEDFQNDHNISDRLERDIS